ncbi:glycosyltransferase 61 family protein [Parasedimentitalea psychrophila]|nr:glycosyltransferase family 61 protein [Parasedimentitalea psychrophila]
MMGFVVPLVHVWPEVVARAAGRPIYVRSCAVMDPILKALKLEGLCILPLSKHRSLKQNAKKLRKAGHRLDYVSVPGFDTPAEYDAEVFLEVRAKLFDQLAVEIAAERVLLEPMFKGDGPRVIIIDRLPPDPFYSSRDCESKGAGSERRSVENMSELADLARSRFTSVAVVTLEGRSLAYQMAMFSMADIIVAQHGAALANLLWARSGANVVEILSSRHIGHKFVPFFFSDLSAAMGLHHDVIHQPSDHGPVCVKDFAVLMDALAQSHDICPGHLIQHSGTVATGGGFIPQNRP